jgi:hypothetical protein
MAGEERKQSIENTKAVGLRLSMNIRICRDPLTCGSDPANDVLDQAHKTVAPRSLLAPRDLAIERPTNNPGTLRTFGWLKVFTSDEPPDEQHWHAKCLSSIWLAHPVFCCNRHWRVRPAPRDPRIPALLRVGQRAPPRLTFATNGVVQVHHHALCKRPVAMPGPRIRRRCPRGAPEGP